MPSNDELAAVFNATADLMEILGADGFRVNAFRKVARTLEDSPHDVTAIGPDENALQALPGVGKGMSQRLAELLRTGQLADLEELRAQVPPGLLELRRVQGLGPKKIALLWKGAGVDSLATLRQKLATAPEELAGLKGMGRKSVENLTKSLEFLEAAGQRVSLGHALPLALWFVGHLRALPGVARADYAGSLRRGRETVGDIDLLVACTPEHAPAVHQAFRAAPPVTDVLAAGATKSSVRTRDHLQVDLRTVLPSQWGAALMYFTGSKEHNVRMRERAQKRGLTLNEYALSSLATGEPIAGASEEEVFKALGLAWVPPELREDRDELTLAQADRLPALIDLRDVHAELHAHTHASDGRWSIEELATACAERGHHTVAVTDHSRSQVQARGLDEARLRRHIADVRAVADRLKAHITVLAGSEVDILADGRLDYDDALLKELDVVVASPHAALTQDPAKATDRLLRALDNRYVTVLGHPTGRLIQRREGLSPDMEKLVAAAKARGVALEINANSMRLDLRDSHARLAVESGVKLAINTDAHGPGDLDQLLFGVLTARRAGATRRDVVNCLSRSGLQQWLQSTRA